MCSGIDLGFAGVSWVLFHRNKRPPGIRIIRLRHIELHTRSFWCTAAANPHPARHPSCPAPPPCPSSCFAASSQPHPRSSLLSIVLSTPLPTDLLHPPPPCPTPRLSLTFSTPPWAPATVSFSPAVFTSEDGGATLVILHWHYYPSTRCHCVPST